MLGRGSRLASGKSDCLVFDFAGQSTQQRLATTQSLLHCPPKRLHHFETPSPLLAEPTLPANPTLEILQHDTPLPSIQQDDKRLKQWTSPPDLRALSAAPTIPNTLSSSPLEPSSRVAHPITPKQQAYLKAWGCPIDQLPATKARAHHVIQTHQHALAEWQFVRQAWFRHVLGTEESVTYRWRRDYQPATTAQQRAIQEMGKGPLDPHVFTAAEAQWLVGHPHAWRMNPTPDAPLAVLPVIVLNPSTAQSHRQTWTLIRPTRADRWIAVSAAEHALYVLGNPRNSRAGNVFSRTIAQSGQRDFTIQASPGSVTHYRRTSQICDGPDQLPEAWHRSMTVWFRHLKAEFSHAPITQKNHSLDL